MKTALFALLFLFAFTTKLSVSASGVVFDVSGEPVKNGGDYHIVPAIYAYGGGLGLAKTGNETCPLTVVQERFEVNFGIPLTISSMLRILVIPTGARVSFSFVAVPTCAETPSEWTIVQDNSTAEFGVKITGYDETVAGFFRINNATLGYNIQFCPAITGSCQNIVVFADANGVKRLVMAENENIAFPFVFVKAATTGATATATAKGMAITM